MIYPGAGASTPRATDANRDRYDGPRWNPVSAPRGVSARRSAEPSRRFVWAALSATVSCDGPIPDEGVMCFDSLTHLDAKAEGVETVDDGVIYVFPDPAGYSWIVLEFPNLDEDTCWWVRVMNLTDGGEYGNVGEQWMDEPLRFDPADPERLGVRIPISPSGLDGTRAYLRVELYAPDGRQLSNNINGVMEAVDGELVTTPYETCDVWEEGRAVELLDENLMPFSAETPAPIYYGPQGSAMITPRLVIDNPHGRDESCAHVRIDHPSPSGGYNGTLVMRPTDDGRLATGNIYDELRGTWPEQLTVQVDALIDGARVVEEFTIPVVPE